MRVFTLEDAVEDIERASLFYEDRQKGVGDYFVESILGDLEFLSQCAGVHRRHFGFHRMLSKRFPFGVYYEVERDTAFVYAILDMRRDPIWIRKELERRK